MFYHDFGRLNFNLPTPSYKLIKSHLFYLAYVMYCFYVRAAYSTFWGRPARYRVHFFELQERPLVATKLAGNGRLNFNLPSLNVIHRRDVVDLNSIYHFRLGYDNCHSFGLKQILREKNIVRWVDRKAQPCFRLLHDEYNIPEVFVWQRRVESGNSYIYFICWELLEVKWLQGY